MAFDWLIKTEYFVTYIPPKQYFWAQVSQDSWSCDEVTLVRPQVNPPVRTARPLMFHNDCYKHVLKFRMQKYNSLWAFGTVQLFKMSQNSKLLLFLELGISS